MWEWSDKLKLGKSAIFVKRDIRSLPQTEAEFEADFVFDPRSLSKGGGGWTGVVVERENGNLLALECVEFPPPTVNCLATLLARAMLRPPEYEDRQRPRTIHLRDRPQWQELLPHLRQLGIAVVLTENLPRFDEEAIQWIQFKRKKPPTAEEIKAALRMPFPPRTRPQLWEMME